MQNDIRHKSSLTDVLFQELHAGGRIIEQIVHRYGGAARAGAGLHALGLAPPQCDSSRRIRPLRCGSAPLPWPRWRWKQALRRGSQGCGCGPDPRHWQFCWLRGAQRLYRYTLPQCRCRYPQFAAVECRRAPMESVICVAPASMAFSSSSFATEAGRSTTSPAAISSAVCLSSTRISAMGYLFLGHGVFFCLKFSV